MLHKPPVYAGCLFDGYLIKLQYILIKRIEKDLITFLKTNKNDKNNTI